jgi:hypothetical protein
MTYFTPVEHDAASGRAADLLAQVQKPLGSTPNMTKVILTNYFNVTAHVDNDWPVVSL